MIPTFALGIPHTPWVEDRVKSMNRLRTALMLHEDLRQSGLVAIKEFTEREKNWSWSGKLWQWGVESGATHLLQLQDDVVPAPNFWAKLRAMVEAVPDQVIALEAVHAIGPQIARLGGRWYTTSDGLIGVGYVFPTDLLREFLVWRATALKTGALEQINEDQLIDLWLLATGRRAWHPAPTIIDHDTEILSTYGNDEHSHRRPSCTWLHWAQMGGRIDQLDKTEFWKSELQPPHMGRFYSGTYQLMRHSLATMPSAERMREIERDQGDHAAQRGLRAPNASDYRIIVATPVMSPEVSLLYSTSIFRLGVAVRDADFSLLIEYDGEGKKVPLGQSITGSWMFPRDLVRARSRCVRRFLATDATHMLFLDADISFDVTAIAGLVSAKQDFIACPYPRKEIDWQRVRKAFKEGKPIDRSTSGYPYRLTSAQPRIGNTVEVDSIGLGCALISRQCLEKMTEAYRDELEFIDDADGDVPTVALFQLLLEKDARGDRKLLGEDYSFCSRWRKLGGKIVMYTGPGSPVEHVGTYIYKGSVDSMLVEAPAPEKDNSDQ